LGKIRAGAAPAFAQISVGSVPETAENTAQKQATENHSTHLEIANEPRAEPKKNAEKPRDGRITTGKQGCKAALQYHIQKPDFDMLSSEILVEQPTIRLRSCGLLEVVMVCSVSL
jgi:hypothetical protein